VNVVLGIDQGSSHTRCVVCDLEGRMLGFGRSQGAYHLFHGMPFAMQVTREAALAAIQQAGVEISQVACIYGGYTGADWPDEYGLLENAVRSLELSTAVHITNDCIVGLRGGTAQPYGAILASGSGTNCAVRAPDGSEFIYHHYVEDELQGGSAIGRRALKMIFRAHTGLAPATSLTGRVLAYFKVSNVDELMRGLVERRIAHDEVRLLAPLVFEEAYRGDPVAAEILRYIGAGWAGLVTNALRRLEMLDLELEVVLSGSVFKGIGSLLPDTIAAGIRMAAPKARLVNARYEPVVGAALLALESLGIHASDQVKDNIEKTAAQLGLIRI